MCVDKSIPSLFSALIHAISHLCVNSFIDKSPRVNRSYLKLLPQEVHISPSNKLKISCALSKGSGFGAKLCRAFKSSHAFLTSGLFAHASKVQAILNLPGAPKPRAGGFVGISTVINLASSNSGIPYGIPYTAARTGQNLPYVKTLSSTMLKV